MSTEPIREFQGEFRFLSNFWPAVVFYEGIEYPSVEHAYQAAKTTDMNRRKEIAGLKTAGMAKKAGKDVIIRSDWEAIKIRVMRELLREKFFSHYELEQKLLATGERELIEGNHWGDTFWGICRGKGQNFLGKCLMQVRQELRDNP